MKISDLKYLSKPHIDKIISSLILTDDELIVLDYCLRGKSIIQTSDKLCVSVRTVSRRKDAINKKLEKAGTYNG